MKNTDIEKLISYCLPEQMALKAILTDELKAMGREVISQDGFIYSPGSHSVLLVAHMDTFHEERRGMPTDINIDKTDPDSPLGVLWSETGVGGDDRCGVYIVMEIIKRLDCHVLYCEDEEKYGIGARKFCQSNISPDVQFIVEFDRQGNDDAVYYGCCNNDFVQFVDFYGFKERHGSFSDISIIAPHLGIAAVNLSSGFYNAHLESEYIRLDDLEPIIDRASPLIADVSRRYEYKDRRIFR
jgi:di/tripeptidase